MRANELHRLKEYVEKQKSFILIAYSNSPNLIFEAKKGYWFVHSYEFASYPAKIRIIEESGSHNLYCFDEGWNPTFELILDNFFQVKEATE